MTMPFTHKKDEVRATGTLEARTPGDQAVQVLLYVIIALVALACVLPFIYVVAGSFATERELTERPFFLIPQDVSLNAYQYILKQGDVFRGLKNSVIVTAIGTLINMFVSCTIAYPLSAPVLASVSLFYAVSHWNSYFNAMLYINNSDMEVITIVLRRLVFLTTQVAEDSTFDWGAAGMPPIKAVKMATTVLSTLPILCIYPFVQKFFTQGVMVGSVKG